MGLRFEGNACRGLVIICLLALASLAHAQQNKQINVLASIKPLQLIAQALTEGVVQTQVLLPTGVTPHDYALKPSDLKKVYRADVLLWLGSDIEPYLAKPVKMYEGTQIAVLETGGGKVNHVPNGDHHVEHHDSESGGHNHLYGDPHIWFSPEEARRVATEFVELLVAQDAENAQRYWQNLSEFLQRLDDADQQIKNQLAEGVGKYLVAHDAYSYFESHYGLSHVAIISDQPESKPGAKGLLGLRKIIVKEQVSCLFVEPQTDPRIVKIIAEGNALQVYMLDPMATDIEISGRGYEQFLLTTASHFMQCR